METLRPKHILVPTDFSDTATVALEHAASLATHFGSHLSVLYADTFLPPIDAAAVPAFPYASEIDERVRAAEARLAEYAKKHLPSGLDCDVRVAVDSPVEAILAYTAEAGIDWIVMGTHGRSGFRRMILGSVTEAVIRKSDRPVLAVRESEKAGGGYQRILCPVVYSEEARVAAEYAAVLASKMDGLVTYLLIIDADEEPAPLVGELDRLRGWVPEKARDNAMYKELTLSRKRNESIIEFARKHRSDLVVIGASQGRFTEETVFGTTPDDITRHAGCPVLVVNQKCVSAVEPAPAQMPYRS
ncbi:MAG TPA: universal stress protein [Thermoanaerobaculia bacterium]|nr:universal stress protein [Thermoanaerobaculia bacterium]